VAQISWLSPSAHFSQDGSNAQFCLSGLIFFAAAFTLDALHRGQEPRRFWLAK
jgi:hypothetical protein